MGLQLQVSFHRSTTIKGTSCMTQGPQTLLLYNILLYYILVYYILVYNILLYYEDLVYMLMTVLCLQLIFFNIKNVPFL